MPLFEFRCAECGVRFEQLCGHDRRESPCSDCGGRAHKVMSTFAARSVEGGDGAPRTSTSIGGPSCATCSGGSCATCR